MKLSIVLSTQPARFEALAYKGDFERNVEEIARLGYDGVELAVRDPKLLDADYVEEVISRLSLEVPAIGTGQAYGEEGLSFTDPDESVRRRAIERIEAQIRFARRFERVGTEPLTHRLAVEKEGLSKGKGSETMRHHPHVIIGLIRGKAGPHVEHEQAIAWLTEALRECAALAEEEGVKLALEPLNRYETNLVNTVAEALRLIKEVGSEAVGLLFDTFHANIEEPSIEDGIRAAGGCLLHVHVADSNRWHPGAGHIDFASIVATLREVGYDGYLSAEILPLPDPHTCAQKTIEFLKSLVRKASIGGC